jgi:hypothetical protein
MTIEKDRTETTTITLYRIGSELNGSSKELEVPLRFDADDNDNKWFDELLVAKIVIDRIISEGFNKKIDIDPKLKELLVVVKLLQSGQTKISVEIPDLGFSFLAFYKIPLKSL